METKTEKAKRLFLSGKVKEAMRIFKGFDRQFDKEQLRVLQIAYESMSGHKSFYRALGIDTDKCEADSVDIVRRKYNMA